MKKNIFACLLAVLILAVLPQASAETAEFSVVDLTLTDKRFGAYTVSVYDSLTFVGSLQDVNPDSCWDVSENRDGSILAWTRPSQENVGHLELYIGSEKTIRFPGGQLDFSGFSGLQKLRFLCTPDVSQVTSLENCFQFCHIEELDLSGWDVSGVTSLYGAFSSCTRLKRVNLSGWDLSNATNLGGLFSGDYNLESVDLSGWNVANAEDLTNMFFVCTALTDVNLSDWNVSSAANLAGMFTYCQNLTSVDLSGWDVSRVTDLHELFKECSALTDVNLSGWDTAHVRDFHNMFNGCEALKNVDFSDWNMASATNLRGMFSGCSSLEFVKLNGSQFTSVTDAGCMFYGCDKLAQLDTAGWAFAPDCVTEHMLYGCRSLSSAGETAEALGLARTLTQADFTDKLSDLSMPEREAIARLQFNDFDISHYVEGDLSETFPGYAGLDLDHDGKTDRFVFENTGLKLHLGNGNTADLGTGYDSLGAGWSAGLLFSDINGTGKEDILTVRVAHSTAGNLLDFNLYVDAGDNYYRQEFPPVTFTMEDLHNDHVLLTCSAFPYREVVAMDQLDYSQYLEEGTSLFDWFFGWNAVNGKAEGARVRNIRFDGRNLVVLYDFLQKSGAAVSSIPFGVVWHLEPGGYFIINRIGTDVVREYWLTE